MNSRHLGLVAAVVLALTSCGAERSSVAGEPSSGAAPTSSIGSDTTFEQVETFEACNVGRVVDFIYLATDVTFDPRPVAWTADGMAIVRFHIGKMALAKTDDMPSEVLAAAYYAGWERERFATDLTGTPYHQVFSRESPTYVAFREGIGHVGDVADQVFWALSVQAHSNDVTFDPGPFFCASGPTWQDFAQSVSRAATIDLYVDLAEAAVLYGSSQCVADDPECPELLRAAASVGEVEVGQPDAWLDRDPTSRSIDLRSSEIPQSVRARLVVIGVHVRYGGDSAPGIWQFGCELGMSTGFVSGASIPLLPVATCIDSPLQLWFEDPRGVRTLAGEFDIAPEAIELGMEVTILGPGDGEKSVHSRTLEKGEASEISGMTSEQLELQRRQYSTPDASAG